MDLTAETLYRMAVEVVGLELSMDDAEEILPYVRSYLETASELETLIATTFSDPRSMPYAEDLRVAP